MEPHPDTTPPGRKKAIGLTARPHLVKGEKKGGENKAGEGQDMGLVNFTGSQDFGIFFNAFLKLA